MQSRNEPYSYLGEELTGKTINKCKDPEVRGCLTVENNLSLTTVAGDPGKRGGQQEQ